MHACRSTLEDPTEICGNAIIDGVNGEECDDTRTAGLSGDGCASACRVEFLTWRDVTTFGPRNREAHAMSEGPNGRVVVFGGAARGLGTNLADTWEWDGTTWLDRTLGAAPMARSDHSMAYDPVRKRVVLFGGNAFGAVALAETWEWDGVRWQQRSPATSPPGRYGTGIAFDAAANKIVIAGGRNATQILNDVWEWDGTTWTQVANLPGPRGDCAMAFLPGVGLVLGGGVPQPWVRALNGTWSAPSWSAAPASRLSPVVAYDPNRGTILLVGGQTLAGTLDDIWEWNGVDTFWSLRTPSGAVPPKRLQAALAYDPLDDRLLLFGGGPSETGPIHEAKYWDGAAATWTDIDPKEAPPPGTNRTVYDAKRAVTVLYNGVETWEWDGIAWARRASASLSPGTNPLIREGFALAYDAAHSVVVMVGGRNPQSPFTVYDDQWNWDGTSWQLVNPPPTPRPSARRDHAMTYDSARNVVVLFGGRNGPTLNSEIWEWNGTWTPRTPASPPSPRYGSALAYDPSRGNVLLFGGTESPAGAVIDTWTWNGTTWTNVLANPANVRSRSLFALAYEPRRREVILYGGVRGIEFYDDVFAWTGTSWQTLAPALIGAPRADISLSLDRFGTLVVFGGVTSGGADILTTARLHYESGSVETELCLDSVSDLDLDGRAGCADPDCWSRCAPLCPPGITCPTASPRCGDAVCGPAEDTFICPADCP